MLLGGNTSEIALGFRIYLNDQFTPKVGKIKNALQGYKSEFNAFQENVRAARNISAGIAATGAVILRTLGSAVREGAKFGFVMQNVGVISEATFFQLERLSSQAKQLGKDTMLMPEDIASGMRFMAMAGQDALQIAQSMPAATNLAGVAMTTLGGKMGAADILTNHLKAYGWEASRSAEMSDKLTAAVTSANVSLVDLGNSVRYVAATSRNVGVPMEQTTAMLMTLGNAGIQASMAGTAVENMMRYLTMALGPNATKRQVGALQQLGLGIQDLTDPATGGFNRFDLVLGKIHTRLAGFGKLDKQNIVKELFGVRGQRGGMTLMRNLDQLTKFMGKLSDPKLSGMAQRKMGEMMNTLEGDFLKVESGIKSLKATLAKQLGPTLRPILKLFKAILDGLEKFIDTKIGKGVLVIAVAVVTLTTALAALSTVLLGLAFANKGLQLSGLGTMAGAARSAVMMNFGRRAPMAASMKGVMKANEGMKYSAKRGMFYTAVPGKGVQWHKKSSAVGKVATAHAMKTAGKTATKTALSKAIPLLGGIGRAAGGMLRFLTGPWGMALMFASAFLPDILAVGKDIFGAAKETAVALADKAQVTEKEMYAMIANSNTTMKQMSDRMMLLVDQNKLSYDQLSKLIANGDLLNFMVNAGIIRDPIEVTEHPSTRIQKSQIFTGIQ